MLGKDKGKPKGQMMNQEDNHNQQSILPHMIVVYVQHITTRVNKKTT